MKYLILFLILSGSAWAACGGGPIVWTSSPDRTSAQTCATNAGSGSTINVTAGSAVWPTPISYSGKALTWIAASTPAPSQGAGTSSVFITCSTMCFDVPDGSAAKFIDISGFNFTGNSANGIVSLDGVMFDIGYRVHNNTFNAPSGNRSLFIERLYGLADHNTFSSSGSGCQMLTTQGSPDGNGTQTDPWTRPSVLGDINASFYEDNILNWNCDADSYTDAYGGARVVFRHNTANSTSTSGNDYGGGHGTDSGGRWGGVITEEVYNNVFNNPSGPQQRTATFRSGTGVWHDNVYNPNSGFGGFTLQLYRACAGPPALDHSGWGECTGTPYRITTGAPGQWWITANNAINGGGTCNSGGSSGSGSGSFCAFCSGNKEQRCSADSQCAATGTGTCSYNFDGAGSHGYPCRNQPGVGVGQNSAPWYGWNNGPHTIGTYDGGVACATTGNAPDNLTPWLLEGRDFINNTVMPGYTPFTYPHPLQGIAPTGTFYVDNAVGHGCSDTSGQPGTLAAPWCTITYALTRIAGGNTLIVKAGTYNGDFLITGPSGTSGQHTVIQEATGESVILSGSGFSSGRVKISHGCSFIDFIGFEITNLNQGLYLDDDAGTSTACTDVTVSNLHIHDVGQEGLAVRAGTPTGARRFVIQNSEIDHTGRLDPAQNGEGAYIGNSSGTDNTNGVTLLNNNIHDTTSECIELKGDSHDNIIDGNNLSNCITSSAGFGNGGGAIEIDEPRNSATNPNQIVRNNFIHDLPTAGGITKRGIRAGTGAKIYNNVLYNIGSTYSCILSNTANFPRVIYNNTVDCSTTNALVNSGTTVDSQNNIGPATAGNNLAINSTYFFNYAGHDYRLVSGAPIGAGANLLATVPTDILGITRTLPMDIGAYKFGSSGTPVAQLSPSSSTFAPVLVNQSSTALVIRISNIGSTSMVVSALGISGDYSIQSNTCGALPSTINAGSNCTANVIFSPIQVGTRVGTFSVTDNAAGSPHTVSLSGTGIAPPGPVTALFAQAR